jgi:hypothetical protein
VTYSYYSEKKKKSSKKEAVEDYLKLKIFEAQILCEEELSL